MPGLVPLAISDPCLEPKRWALWLKEMEGLQNHSNSCSLIISDLDLAVIF